MKFEKKRKLSERARNIDTGNPHPRVAMCLCLDTSSSMLGHPIRALQSGLRNFYKALWQNSESRYAADLAVVTFGCEGAKCVQDFTQLYEKINPPLLEADGLTPMGEAINLALDMLEERRNAYWELNIRHYHSRLIIMADGKPNGNARELIRAATRSRELVNQNKLVVIPVGVGNEADMYALAQFSTKILPKKLKDLDFTSFFKWLSVSVEEVVSQSPEYEEDLPLDKARWIDGNWNDFNN